MEEHKLSDWLRQFIDNPDQIELIEASEDRIKQGYKELLSGCDADAGTILNTVESEYYPPHGQVSGEPITFTSFCGHHFLPYFGTVRVTYLPNSKITGIGKIPRLVDAVTRKFILQEDIGPEIAEHFENALQPLGVYVEVEATHTCVACRGPKAIGSVTKTKFGTGVFENEMRKI